MSSRLEMRMGREHRRFIVTALAAICIAGSLLIGDLPWQMAWAGPRTSKSPSSGAAHAGNAKAVASSASVAYEQIRQRYFRLRNTDEHVLKEPEWRAVAKELQDLVDLYPKTPEAAQALWNLSHLYEELHRVSESDADGLQSLAFLTVLLRRFPTHELADDALFRAATLQEDEFHDLQAARRLYERLVERFPRSEYALKAQRALERGRRQSAQAFDASSVTRTRRFVVVLDPGHGGEDLGAKGPGGLYEKDVVLAVALQAERILEANPDIQVELTRREDQFVPLAERTRVANAWRADAFVSLHNNASEKGALSGAQAFYLNAADDEAGRLLAERENGDSGGLQQVDDISLILGDLTQSAKQEPSITLAHLIQDAILNRARSVWREARDSGVRPGPFYVLVGAHMPCVLVELFFIDHMDDGRKLATERFRKALAQGLARGIEQFLERSDTE